MAPRATIVSYRLGGTDGVSVEAAKWAWALGQLGFDVRRIAGTIDNADEGDLELPGLLIEGGNSPTEPEALLSAWEGSALIVAENICSLPLAPGIASRVARALEIENTRGTRVVLHHHDLASQRRHLAAMADTFPPDLAGALHVTINLRSMRELASRGIRATTMHNRFDFDSPPGDRETTRRKLGFRPDELVLLQPTRAIERKNIPGAVRYLRDLAAMMPTRALRYWLTGPAEDGYGETLSRVLAHCPIPVTTGRVDRPADAYAASDVVLFPSTWEGFGNPAIESIIAQRPLVAFGYPVLSEITAFGIRFLDLSEPETLVRRLARPDERRLDLNLHKARGAFDLELLPSALTDTFASHGWTSW